MKHIDSSRNSNNNKDNDNDDVNGSDIKKVTILIIRYIFNGTFLLT